MEDDSGKIFHGRNLDYSLDSAMLRAITIVVDFVKNGTVSGMLIWVRAWLKKK